MSRCADCGYLAVRNIETRELVEVERGMLDGWAIPASTARPAFKLYEDIPFCFVMAANLHGEIGAFSPDMVLSTVRKERECPAFCPRQRGFTPKEHREMQIAQQITAEQQRFQQEQRERDREWEIRQEAATRQWQQEQDQARRERETARDQESRAWQESQNRLNRQWQGILALIAAVVGFLGVLVGAYLKK